MRRSILIVDDEYGLAEVLAEMLVDDGYDVAVTVNGHLALRVLRQRRVSLVLTDIMMPVMTGIELARAMKADAAMRMIPIVAMTSIPSWDLAEANPFELVLLKPFSPAQLKAALVDLLPSEDDAPGSAQHQG